MNTGIATWDSLTFPAGNILVIINSPDYSVEPVTATLEALSSRVARASIFIVTPPALVDWLLRTGYDHRQVLVATDVDDGELEINYFLSTTAAILWSRGKNFRLVIGTMPHSLYNDEVKTVFEPRALFLAPEARLVTHALPLPYVYVLDTTEVLERLNRGAKIEKYQSTVHLLTRSLHAVWERRGRPGPEAPSSQEVATLMRETLDPALLAYHDDGPDTITTRHVGEPVVDLVRRLYSVVHRHVFALESQRLILVHELEQQKAFLAEVQAERIAAVDLRDQLLDELRRKNEPFWRKLARWMSSRR